MSSTPSTPDGKQSAAIESAAEMLGQLQTQIGHAIVGQTEVVEDVLITLAAGGHALIEGVPGIGKTLLARALAQAFRGASSRVQFTPDLMPADVLGHMLYDARSGEMKLRRGPVFTHLLLADEINRAPAKTQAALLEVMQERQVTIEGDSLELPAPFITLATQNPLEMEGTYPLPEAQLDRFLLKIQADYPSEGEEVALTQHVTGGRVGDALVLDAVTPVATPDDIVRIQDAAAQVYVDERVVEYAVRLGRATRTRSSLSVGAGPRGPIALVRAARARALLGGRAFVTPDDVKQVAHAALRHRIQLAATADLEGQSSDDVIRDILSEVEAPRQ